MTPQQNQRTQTKFIAIYANTPRSACCEFMLFCPLGLTLKKARKRAIDYALHSGIKLTNKHVWEDGTAVLPI